MIHPNVGSRRLWDLDGIGEHGHELVEIQGHFATEGKKVREGQEKEE